MAKAKSNAERLAPVPAPERAPEPPKPGSAPLPEAGARWIKPKGLTWKGWCVLGGALVAINIPMIHHYLRSAPTADQHLPYSDTFDSDATIPAHYFTTGGLWRTRDGELLSPGVKNNPLWLRAELPHDVRIDFDVEALAPSGDIRVELFGDGVDHLSGYELVQGGWGNARSAIVRLDERGKSFESLEAEAQEVANRNGTASDLVKSGVFDRDTPAKVERSGKAVMGRTYHWTIERRGHVLRWSIDGKPYLQMNDPFPLSGDHDGPFDLPDDRFGLSSAEGPVLYDNLKIVALKGGASLGDDGPTAQKKPLAPGPFSDDFDRETLGPAWDATNPDDERIVDGAVSIHMGHNRPLWLTHPIPTNAVIEFDAWSDTPEGDIKVEAWGDGHSYYQGDLRLAYTSTSYDFIFGGWHNTETVIAREAEHGRDRLARKDLHVTPGKHYHWKITRKGGDITWEIDGRKVLEYHDPHPLEGPGHQYFAFTDWEASVHFDNLKIRPL